MEQQRHARRKARAADVDQAGKSRNLCSERQRARVARPTDCLHVKERRVPLGQADKRLAHRRKEAGRVCAVALRVADGAAPAAHAGAGERGCSRGLQLAGCGRVIVCGLRPLVEGHRRDELCRAWPALVAVRGVRERHLQTVRVVDSSAYGAGVGGQPVTRMHIAKTVGYQLLGRESAVRWVCALVVVAYSQQTHCVTRDHRPVVQTWYVSRAAPVLSPRLIAGHEPDSLTQFFGGVAGPEESAAVGARMAVVVPLRPALRDVDGERHCVHDCGGNNAGRRHCGVERVTVSKNLPWSRGWWVGWLWLCVVVVRLV
jgi:hypothetical protein